MPLVSPKYSPPRPQGAKNAEDLLNNKFKKATSLVEFRDYNTVSFFGKAVFRRNLQ